MELYPLKFSPLFFYRVWGGDKLNTALNKNTDRNNIGESWEISAVEKHETLVKNGELKGKSLSELIKTYESDFLGQTVFDAFGIDFPLLIKFIDAQKPLSIQVHPNNELANKRHGSFGKNEMWYIMEADEDAELIIGFKEQLSKADFLNHLTSESLVDVLNREKVTSGDVFNIPTGRVHAIGAGVMLAEIQQTSDITYRIYDYNRVDQKTGNKRELHTELALDAIDFSVHSTYKIKYDLKKNESNKLVHTPYFKTNIIKICDKLERDYTTLDSFVIYICVAGNLSIKHQKKTYDLAKGEVLLLPAIITKVSLTAESATLLEVSL